MILRYSSRAFASLSIVTLASVIAFAQSNVVVIVADDAGYADFGFSNGISGSTSQIPTPNLDSLAARGVRFSRAYVGQSCQPTRAALVTGGYQNRIGNEVVGNNLTSASGVFEGVPVETTTIWERMKSVGYTTGAVGKWHLGQIEDFGGQLGNRPQNQGVDQFYGIWHGSRTYNVGNTNLPETQLLREAIVQSGGNITDTVVEAQHAGEYITNTFGDYAVDFISDHHDAGNPFFLYQSFTAPHTPMHNSPDFNDPRLAGLTGIRKQYGSMMLTMDNEIGRILNRLDDPNGDGNTSDSITDDTMIVFINDNGGAHAGSSSPNGADNGQFRAGKGTPYEGGIRVPMIVAGAGVSQTAQGTTYDAPVHGVDILPTAFAAGGGTIGPGAPGIDGVNLLPFINGTDTTVPHEVLVHRHRTQFAVIKGDWKLVHTNGNPSTNYQLYNLNSDVGETSNLAGSNPNMVQELLRDLTDHEVTFDKQRYAILGRTAEDTINLFDHFKFNPDVPGSGNETVIIGGTTGNGDFSAGGDNPSGAQSYEMTPNWFNAQAGETINFTNSTQMNGSSDPSSILRGGMPFQNRTQINDTGHTITQAGEEFSISYDFGAGGGAALWDNAEDMRTFLFTTSSTVDGNTTVADIVELASDTYSIDRAADGQWTQYSSQAFYTSTAADIGKTVYFGMQFLDGDNGDGLLFPRIDIVRLTTTGGAGGTSTTNWSEMDAWFEAGTSTEETMFSSDAFAGAILEFPTTDDFSYISNNDMFRQTGQDFMLNQIVLSGTFSGSSDQSATIQGNSLLFTKSLEGALPQIAINANQAGGNDFNYAIDLDVIMYDDLTISGNGNVGLTINGQIRDYFAPRGLTKTGSSLVTLTGDNVYAGNTLISGGTLALTGNATLSNTPRIEVQAGATFDVSGRNAGSFSLSAGQTLGGSGTVLGTISATTASTVAPGSSIGRLTIAGNYSQASNAVLEIELGAGTVAGVDHDQLTINGSAALGGNLEITAIEDYSEPATRGQVDALVLVAAQQIIGNFDAAEFDGEALANGTNYVGTGSGSLDGLFRILQTDATSVTLTNYLALPGDANGDLIVDGLDFIIWNENKFTNGTDWSTGDFNGDGLTDGLDFIIWNDNKFTSVDLTSVPEPSTVGLLAIAIGTILGCRHR